MVVPLKNLLHSGKRCCILAKWLYSAKMVVFGQNSCIRDKVVVFGQIFCIRAKVVVFGQK